MTKPTLENWRKEFDKKFRPAVPRQLPDVFFAPVGTAKEMKSFISSLLLSLLERVELDDNIDATAVHPDHLGGYCKAIKDLQSLKKKLREEVKK